MSEVEYRHMHGDDPVKFGFDLEGNLVIGTVSREAIEECLSVPADGDYATILNQSEMKVSHALASWLATDKPSTLSIDRSLLTMIMDKYNAH